MKKEDITRKAEQSSIERYPIFISEGVDVNYSMRMEHGYAFELGATWMEEYAHQPAVSECPVHGPMGAGCWCNESQPAVREEEIRKIRTALSLLNSMVVGGENHSSQSKRMLAEAMSAVQKLIHSLNVQEGDKP